MIALADSTSATPWRTTSRYAWFVLTLLVGVYTFNWLARYIFIILMESIKLDLHISDTALGFLSGFAFAVIYSTAGIPIARWADRGNRRSIIALGLATWSLMTALCGVVTNGLQLALARLGVGLGEAACSPPAHSLISDYFPLRQRATAFAIYGLGVSIGITVGLSLGGWINEHYGWRAAFAVAGLPGLLFALVVRFAIWEPPRGRMDTGHVDSAHYSWAEVLRFLAARKSFVAYATGLGLFNFAGQAFDNWSPVFLMRVDGMGSAEVGAWTGALGGVAGLVGTLVVGILADRLSGKDLRWNLWITVWVIAVMIPSILLFLFAPPQLRLPLYAVSILGVSAYLAPFIAITQKVMPLRMRALSSATLFIFLNLIGAFGPFLTGVLNDIWTGTLGKEAVRYSIACTQLAGIVGIGLVLYAARRLPTDFDLMDRAQ